MDIKGIKEFWEVARKHPMTATLLVLIWAVTSIGWEVVHPKLLALFQSAPPFANIAGEYTGEIHDSGPFIFCLETHEADRTTHEYDVRGTMTFSTGTYVDYWGSSSGNRLNLAYARANSATPDTGTAIFYAPDSKGRPLIGYYKSNEYPANRQNLTLTSTGHGCQLNQWTHGW
jgi:hypothetical protein